MSEHPDCLSPLCDCMDGCAVQAVANAARSAALEEAAKVAEGIPNTYQYAADRKWYASGITNDIAAAIRALKDK